MDFELLLQSYKLQNLYVLQIQYFEIERVLKNLYFFDQMVL